MGPASGLMTTEDSGLSEGVEDQASKHALSFLYGLLGINQLTVAVWEQPGVFWGSGLRLQTK